MRIKSYESLDQFMFSDREDDILRKLEHEIVNLSDETFMGKNQRIAIVKKLNLKIVFSEEESISFFEVFGGKVYFEDVQLIGSDYLNIKSKLEKIDPNLIVDQHGFESPKFGFGVSISSHFSNEIDQVIVFDRKYLHSPTPSPDDIIKHFLGK